MRKSQDDTKKIIESGYNFSQNGDKEKTSVIKRWAVLGVFFFILNICFIIGICFNRKVQGPKDTAVMVQGAENEAEHAELDKEQSGSKVNQQDKKDKVDKQTDKQHQTSKKDNVNKRVYLTFDDGPSKNTEKVLDILKEYDVHATFFVIGKEDEFSKSMYKRIVEEGHTLGMHSYSHKYNEIYESKKAFFQDYRKIKKLLYDVTGVRPVYYRFPGGTSNTISKVSMKSLASGLTKRGSVYFDWNAMSGDATGKDLTKKQMINNVLKDVEIHNTSVVLMHDASEKDKTVEMLPDLLKKLKKMKVDILPIDGDTPLVQHVKVDDK